MKRFALVLTMLGCGETRIDAGHDHFDYGLALGAGVTCSHAEGESLRCLGLGDRGQLTFAPEELPDDCGGRACSTAPLEGSHVAYGSVLLGRDFGCAVVSDGVQCFGDGRYGQRGNGTRDAEPHPVVDYIEVWYEPLALAVARNHACVISRSGEVFCWGDGTHGQLGQPPEALDDCGTVETAADEERFQSPIGTTIRCSATPLSIDGIRGATGLWAGGAGTCFRSEDAVVRCVGRNVNGALGVETQEALVATPTRALAQGVGKLALGPRHGCALDDTGALHCFGEGDLGQLAASNLDGAIDVAVGDDVTYVLDGDHALLAAGDDGRGQLGDGSGASGDCGGTPCGRSLRRVALPRATTLVRSGADHACAVLSDHRLFCWGAGSSGALGDALREDAHTPRELRGVLFAR